MPIFIATFKRSGSAIQRQESLFAESADDAAGILRSSNPNIEILGCTMVETPGTKKKSATAVAEAPKKPSSKPKPKPKPAKVEEAPELLACLLYTSPSPRDS